MASVGNADKRKSIGVLESVFQKPRETETEIQEVIDK